MRNDSSVLASTAIADPPVVLVAVVAAASRLIVPRRVMHLAADGSESAVDDLLAASGVARSLDAVANLALLKATVRMASLRSARHLLTAVRPAHYADLR
jgi:hypothetical protein